MKDRAVVIGAVALGAVALGCVTFLVAIGRDPTPVMTAVVLVIVPTLGALLAGQVGKIEANTNGNTSALLALVERLSTPQGTPGATRTPQEPPADDQTPDGRT